jgi:hypothetical protein
MSQSVRKPILKLALRLFLLMLVMDQCVFAYCLMAGIGGEVEDLLRLGLALRWVPWLLGVPIVFPLLSHTTPQSLEQFANSTSDELLAPLMGSNTALVGYFLNAVLWATVVVILTRPREPRRLWNRRRR